ncbi:metal-sulfur cluster assembly factor [uncultured Campylobacter sp.]|uniref:metal-sulfur cluster assembly factor n=1 Tax=uncultured Campylobacter sp. TaxID=218934 RepID=UPI0026361CA4|nr:metal-sulfur cluster assembly factor [uncultured Campylobacter sp.]
MKVTKEQVYDALRAVVDPEVGFDVVSLGLIYDVAVDEANNAKVTMTLSTQSCPLHEMMVEWVRAGAESVDGVGEVEIDLVFEPMWNIDMAEDHVKEALGKF